MVIFRLVLVLICAVTYFMLFLATCEVHLHYEASKADYDDFETNTPLWLMLTYVVAFAFSAYNIWFTIDFWNAVSSFMLMELIAIMLTLLLRWYFSPNKGL